MKQRLDIFGFLCRFALFVAVICLGNVEPTRAADISVVGAAAGTRALTLIIEEPTFDWPITIRRDDSTDGAAPVRIDVTPLTGPSARPVEDQRLLSNGQAVNPAGLEISPLDQAVVQLTGTLPVEGDFTGQLGVIVDGKRTSYDLKITRRKPANPPKVAIVGVGSDGRLSMTSDRAAFKWPITIRRDDTLENDLEIKMRAAQFTGPSGTLIQAQLQKDDSPLPEALKLSPLGQEFSLAGR